MVQAQTYQDASRTLLEQGFAELEQRDLRQASEKAWGAAAQMLKSIAERRGWEHKGHRFIRRVASRLANETGDVEIRRLYRVASDLHTNFYEDLDTAEDVTSGLEDVQRFLDKLAPLLAMARYLVNPATNVVHREGGCSDARSHGDTWNPVGYFSSLSEAAVVGGSSPDTVAKSCQNCSRGEN